MINNLFLLSSLGLFISTIILITHWDPIRKLLSLISLFLFSTFIFLLINFFFLGLTYLIVYVGAIAILFLFVIMMVPLENWLPSQKQIDWVNNNKLLYYIAIFLLAALLASANKENSFEKDFIFSIFDVGWADMVYTSTDIEVLGNLLYIKWPLITVLLSIVLWLILIAVLWITLG
jgi:NADH-ubiquinone oxidoreductase chain 6